MTFKPSFFSIRALNCYLMFVSFTTVFFLPLFLFNISSFTIISAAVGLILPFRVSLYYFFERITITDDKLRFYNILGKSYDFNLNKINSLSILPFYGIKYGTSYVFIENTKITKGETIELSTQNFFQINTAWSEKTVLKIIQYVKSENPELAVDFMYDHNFVLSGRKLVPAIFN